MNPSQWARESDTVINVGQPHARTGPRVFEYVPSWSAAGLVLVEVQINTDKRAQLHGHVTELPLDGPG